MEQEEAEDLERAPQEELTEEQKELVKRIREKKQALRTQHQNEKVFRSHTALPSKYKEKSIDEFESHLMEMGIDPTVAGER